MTTIIIIAVAILAFAIGFWAGSKALGWAIQSRGEKNLSDDERETLGRLLKKVFEWEDKP